MPAERAQRSDVDFIKRSIKVRGRRWLRFSYKGSEQAAERSGRCCSNRKIAREQNKERCCGARARRKCKLMFSHHGKNTALREPCGVEGMAGPAETHSP